MNLFSWFTALFSQRGKALSLYRRGMRRAQQHDHQGAIEDYTATIDRPDAPADVKAMARFNRGLVHVAAGDLEHGIEDLNAVLVMPGASENVRTMARRKLVRMESRPRKNE
ncbi:MAG: hypothetical protein WD070_03570 [Pirellulaceae bacterium]